MKPIAEQIEDEVRVRVACQLDALTKEAERIRAQQQATELDLAIARWAIAGILSRNLHIQIQLDTTQLADQVAAVRIAGKAAGAQFFHEAELHFKDHARLAELLAYRFSREQPVHISTNREFEVSRKHWPKP